jgi:hypothetical protein
MLEPGAEVEVRCHTECPWSGAWEVADVVLADGGPQYQVRRRGQETALLTLLPAADVRQARPVAFSRAG